MSLLVEQTLNEIQMAGGINTAKPLVSTSTGTFAAIVNNGSQTVTGNQVINGNATVGGTLAVTGAVTIQGALTSVGLGTFGATGTSPAVTLGAGGPQVISGTLIPPANPTGVSATLGSLFINLGATGVTNRVYINTNGATGWTFLGTSGA